jgi:sugar/nucleoside kinase (ribokinase family)
MRPSAEVFVVGDALLDVYVAPSEPMRPGGDVPAVVRVGPGGQGANVAVRLARHGLTVRLACALGDDASGRLVREALEADGVELDAASAEMTGAVVILVAPDGERTMLSRRVTLLPRATEPAPWTVVSGYVLLEGAKIELSSAGRLVVLGCSLPDAHLRRWWQRVTQLAPELLLLNGDEAGAVGAIGRSSAASASTIVVVTDRSGASAVLPDGTVRRALAERATGVDTTGAGDAFAAAFLAELHDLPAWADSDLDRALAAGVALAAQVAGVTGAQTRVARERPA